MEGHADGDVVQELSKWFDELVYGWINGWQDGRVDGWMGGQMDDWSYKWKNRERQMKVSTAQSRVTSKKSHPDFMLTVSSVTLRHSFKCR